MSEAEKIKEILNMLLDDYLEAGVFNKDKLTLISNLSEFVVPKLARVGYQVADDGTDKEINIQLISTD